MSTSTDDPHAGLRRSVYLILILAGIGGAIGRILAVDAVNLTGIQEDRVKKALGEYKRTQEKQGLEGEALQEALAEEKARLQRALKLRRPFLSGNDRSRWCTVRALVEPEMQIETAPYSIDKVIQQPGWDTIDMVKHDGAGHAVAIEAAAEGHLYSSKPPLLPTLMAQEYWLIYRLTGKTLGDEPFAIGRFMLITINGGFLLLYFLALAKLIERLGTSDWGRIFTMAAAVFGTYLTTFSVVINNHLPAAASAAVALYAAVRIWFDGERRWSYFAAAGFFAAFMAANELPAALLAAVLSLALLWKAPRQTLAAYVPAALVVTLAFFGTNWMAHGTLVPAYAHRKPENNWYDYTFVRKDRPQPLRSYWADPQGIDRGEPSMARYALHATIGHHGIFSLTPVWLLSLAGAVLWLARGPDRRLRELGILVAVVSLVCVTFYLVRPQIDRNYGGTSSALRWAFWMVPLWLAAMLPAVDAMSKRRWARGLALLLLVLSAMSASYPIWNPWTHPWLMDYMTYAGLL